MLKKFLMFAVFSTIFIPKLFSMEKDDELKKNRENLSKVLRDLRITILSTGLNSDLRAIVAGYVGNLHAVFDKSNGGHNSLINLLFFSSDNKSLFSFSPDGDKKIWDINSPNCKYTSSIKNDAQSFLYFPKCQYFFSTDFTDRKLSVWETLTNNLLKTIDLERRCFILKISPDYQLLAAGLSSGEIKLLDLKTFKVIQNLDSSGTYISGLAYSPNGKFLASRNSTGTLKIWDTKTYNCIKTLKGEDYVYGLSFSPDNKFLASAVGNNINIFDMDTLQYTYTLIATLASENVAIRSLTYSNDGRRLAAGISDGSIKIWDINTQRCIQTFDENKKNDRKDNSIYLLVYSPCGQYLASARHSTIKIWIDSDAVLLAKSDKDSHFSIKEDESKLDSNSFNISGEDNKHNTTDCCVIS